MKRFAPSATEEQSAAAPGRDGIGAGVAIVAFHFFPSHEVGAKRMSAVARTLVNRGWRLAIFSVFEGLETLARVRTTHNGLEDYDLEQIPDQRSSIIALLVFLKRSLRRTLWGATPDGVRDRTGSGAVGSESRKRAWLNRQLFNILLIIDDKKRWTWKAARRLLSLTKRRPISVIIVSGPPMSSLLGGVLAGRAACVPVIVDLRDPIWLEPSELSSLPTASVQWGRRALERYVVKHAYSVVTTSPTLRERLQARYPEFGERFSCILNGYDDDPTPAPASTGNRLVIVYAGTLYLNRNPFPFLEAVERLVKNPEVDASHVEVVFAGDCAEYQGISLSAWVATRRCAQLISIHNRLDATELRQLYERSTVILNFAEGQPMQIPAKTFELLALGRELLMFCEPDSDTAAVAAGISGVWCLRTKDAAALDRALLDLYRRHVVQGTLHAPMHHEISAFSRASQNERYRALVERAKASACSSA